MQPLLPRLHIWFFIVLFAGFPVAVLAESPSTPVLTSEQVVRQELLLNRLIVKIHLLQIDSQNAEARESILDIITLLDASIPNLTAQTSNQEVNGLLETTQFLWPVISRHAGWLSKLPERSAPPEVNSLLRVLGRLDRQLVLLRQTLITQQALEDKPELSFLEQAVLMQRLSREYLSLISNDQSSEIAKSGRQQLQTLVEHFDQRMNRLTSQYQTHPFAGKPMRQARVAWLFIASGIQKYPQQSAPVIVAHYSERIVGKLTSVHKMF